ncbi:transposase [Bradyrhizobium sp. Arg816]|nr:transposase [Bradyrhizobium sp. Arg816]
MHNELAAFCSHTGRPSIDPVLVIRMLVLGYAFALRSERRLFAEVQVNLASEERERECRISCVTQCSWS